MLLSPEFTHHRLTPLRPQARWLLIVLEALARRNPFLWHGNAKLMDRSGFNLTSLKEILRELAKAGWIEVVYRGKGRRHRAGILMLRRTSDVVPAADTPERVEEGRFALLVRWRPSPAERSYRWRESALTVAGNPTSVEGGNPPQNKDEFREDKLNEEVSVIASPPQDREPTPTTPPLATTLSGESEGGESDGEDAARDLERLRSKLSPIADANLDRRKVQGHITTCATWLASKFADEHSHGRYCGMLQRVAKGELSAEVAAQAFKATWVDLGRNDVADPGRFFFGAIRSIEARSITDAEMMAEHAAIGGALTSSPDPGAANPPDWFRPVEARVMKLLDDARSCAGHGDGRRLQKVAGEIQHAMAGHYQGNASKLYLALVEAVALGYEVAHIEILFGERAAIPGALDSRDIREWVRHLDPDPREWLRRNASPRDRFFDLSARPTEALIR